MSQFLDVNQDIVWDQTMLNKYNKAGPRYSSYPTVLELHQAFTVADYDMACTQYPERPLSLYIHIPFCHKFCYYCGCNKVVTRLSHKANEYLDALELEIRTRAALLQGRKVHQLHFGGGTPTFLSQTQISRIMGVLRHEFDFDLGAELSIEIDPRDLPVNRIDQLRGEGFNRLSIGVQDVNKDVQKSVNREQNETLIAALVARAKKLDFRSTNLDLIYGLPKQTPASFAETLEKVLKMKPGRISVFNYAHMPELFATQRKIQQQDLPNIEQRMTMLQDSLTTLTQQGYQAIGMDHFALPNDELAIAQRQGILHRNFQGYTTQGDCDLVGFGVSAISMVGDVYAQNHKQLKAYYQQVEDQRHALCKGLTLDSDDLLRRDIIKQLMCNFTLDIRSIERRYDVCFDQYFQSDLALLVPFIEDKLVNVQGGIITVTVRGRLLIRYICMCFDRYLRRQASQQHYSKVI
jgi:oxygen-independent coproporphyrinogen-3 oxidase